MAKNKLVEITKNNHASWIDWMVSHPIKENQLIKILGNKEYLIRVTRPVSPHEILLHTQISVVKDGENYLGNNIYEITKKRTGLVTYSRTISQNGGDKRFKMLQKMGAINEQ